MKIVELHSRYNRSYYFSLVNIYFHRIYNDKITPNFYILIIDKVYFQVSV